MSIFDCCDVFFADVDICLLTQLYLPKFLFREHFPGLWLPQHHFPLCLSTDSPFAALQLHNMRLEFVPASVCSTWTSVSGVDSQLWFPITPAPTTHLLIFQGGIFVLSSPKTCTKLPMDISSNGGRYWLLPLPCLVSAVSYVIIERPHLMCSVCWDKQVWTKALGSWAAWWWKQYKCLKIWVLIPLLLNLMTPVDLPNFNQIKGEQESVCVLWVSF